MTTVEVTAEARSGHPLEQLELQVTGMTCGSCAMRVQRTLAGVPGVSEARVNYATARASLTIEAGAVDVSELVAAVRKSGYDAGIFQHLVTATRCWYMPTTVNTHPSARRRRCREHQRRAPRRLRLPLRFRAVQLTYAVSAPARCSSRSVSASAGAAPSRSNIARASTSSAVASSGRSSASRQRPRPRSA